MKDIIEIATWASIMLPMLGVTVYWAYRTHSKVRTMTEALVAIAVSIAGAMALGALVGPPSSFAYVMIPFAVGGGVMAMGLNRTLRKRRDRDYSLSTS